MRKRAILGLLNLSIAKILFITTLYRGQQPYFLLKHIISRLNYTSRLLSVCFFF